MENLVERNPTDCRGLSESNFCTVTLRWISRTRAALDIRLGMGLLREINIGNDAALSISETYFEMCSSGPSIIYEVSIVRGIVARTPFTTQATLARPSVARSNPMNGRARSSPGTMLAKSIARAALLRFSFAQSCECQDRLSGHVVQRHPFNHELRKSFGVLRSFRRNIRATC